MFILSRVFVFVSCQRCREEAQLAWNGIGEYEVLSGHEMRCLAGAGRGDVQCYTEAAAATFFAPAPLQHQLQRPLPPQSLHNAFPPLVGQRLPFQKRK